MATLSLLAGLALTPATFAAAPPADRIGPGKTLVTLSGGAAPGSRAGSSRDGAVIARVRRMLNALPVYRPALVCPDDLTVPSVLAFYRTPTASPYARVSFQLGGCPRATVTRGGRVVGPPLGGPRLLATIDAIRTLIDRPNPTA